MKNIITAMLLLLTFSASAQTVTLHAGTQGYVTINGQNYTRGDLRSYYTYRTNDSLLTIIYAHDKTVLIPATIDTNYLYGDSSNAKARNMGVLRTWMNTNFEYKP